MQIVTEMYANPHMVGQGRLELPTPGLGNQCSVQLSYCPVSDARYDIKYALHRLGGIW